MATINQEIRFSPFGCEFIINFELESVLNSLSDKQLEEYVQCVNDMWNERQLRASLGEIGNAKVGEMSITTRAHNCLDSLGIKTIADLYVTQPNELMKIPNMGRKTLKNIIEAFREFTGIKTWGERHYTLILQHYPFFGEPTPQTTPENKKPL